MGFGHLHWSMIPVGCPFGGRSGPAYSHSVRVASALSASEDQRLLAAELGLGEDHDVKNLLGTEQRPDRGAEKGHREPTNHDLGALTFLCLVSSGERP